MLRLIYTSILYLAQPFLWLWILLKSCKTKGYAERLGERYGFYGNKPQSSPQGIHVHAASVGEVIAATPLIKAIMQAFPERAITITTMTRTGSARVKATFGDTVNHYFLPYDLPDAMARFVKFVRPKVSIIIETELWANLIEQLYKQQIPVIIANARLSPRSARRYRKINSFMQPMLDKIELIAPQDKLSEQRYQQIGYQGKIATVGNIKYDLQLSAKTQENITALSQQWKQQRPIWIGASTHEGEDEIILQAHQQLLTQFPDLLLILVPRHPERFNNVANLIAQQGFSYVRRSEKIAPSAETQVLLGDTMGELMLMYGLADVAFVGGSFIPRGGHNPLEPLTFKIPVICGKHTFNFADIFQQLRTVQGVIEIDDESKTAKNDTALSSNLAQKLAIQVAELLKEPQKAQAFGEAGFRVLASNRGAIQRFIQLLKPYLTE